MKRILIALVVCGIAAAGAGAQQMMAAPGFSEELSAAVQDLGTAPIGTLTVADLTRLAARISLAQQKLMYVQKARIASMIVPGMGQFMTGDPLGGSLYLVADIAIAAGAMVGAYYLMPDNVKTLDYLNTPLAALKGTWEGNTAMQYLPAMGVMAGGMLVKMILGHFAASGAAAEARDNIQQGKVDFKPVFGFMGNRMGMGMEMRF